MKRRTFIESSLCGVAGGLTLAKAEAEQLQQGKRPSRPVVISSRNGLQANEKAMKMMREGADTLDAVIAGVNIVEADPEDRSVGYGGLPNEDGVVQLDASVMHGPSNGAGAVASLEGFVHPSKIARDVMQKTDHVLLVGEGALKFALAMGYEKQNLLTDESREIWLKWKRDLSENDDWINPADRLPKSMTVSQKKTVRDMMLHHGTINCNAVNEKGEISGVTTTSGLAFKIPGRVGDSPIFGAGLYVDNDIGACGSTGRGEANLKTCASFMVVEYMRQGVAPEEAGLRVMKRIVEKTTEPYLLRGDGKPAFGLNFYILNTKGEYAGVNLYKGPRAQYAVHDGVENRLRDSAYLYEA